MMAMTTVPRLKGRCKVLERGLEQARREITRLKASLERVKADDKRHSEDARSLREINKNISERCDQHERERGDFQTHVSRLERQRDDLHMKAQRLESDVADRLKLCKALNESLKYALTHSFHAIAADAMPERTFEIRELEEHVQSACQRIFNDEQEKERLQGILNGTAIAVGILGQKLSRG